MSDEETQNQALETFASKALRRNKPGSYEQLLCMHLVKAVSSDPIEKIRLVCEAALMVPDYKIKEKGLDIIYPVAASFVSTRINVVIDAPTPGMPDWDGVIAWSFTPSPEAYEKYIIPWTDDAWLYRKGRFKTPDKFDEWPVWRQFFFYTRDATNSTLEILKARFTIWSMPIIMQVFEELSKLVNPDVFTEMMGKVRQ